MKPRHFASSLSGLLCALIVGCGGSSAPEQAAPRSRASVGDDDVRARRGVTTIILANENGIHRLNPMEGTRSSLCDGPALHPRVLPDGSVLYLASARGPIMRCSEEGARVEIHLFEELSDGDRRRLERTSGRSEAEGELARLGVFDAADFWLTDGGGVACVAVMDGPPFEAEIRATLQISLGRDALVLERATLAADGLYEMPEAERVCSRRTERPRVAVAAGAELPEPLSRASSAPDGRHSVVTGEPTAGDYVWTPVYILDEASGELFPIVDGPWPPPASRERILAGEVETLALIASARPIWFAEGEALIAGSKIVLPGSRVSSEDGELVADTYQEGP